MQSLRGNARSDLSRVPGIAQVILLMVGSCLPVMAAVLIAPVLPRIQAHFADLPNVQVLVPIMLTIPALVLGLMAPFAGALLDRLGRKPLLLAGLLLYGLAGTAPLWLENLHAIIASRALVGLAEAAVMTCCTTLVGDYWDGSRRERLLTLQTVFSSLAATAFFFIGGSLGELGWRMPFWLYTVGFLLWLPCVWLLWEPMRAQSASNVPASPKEPFPLTLVTTICAVTLLAAVAFYLVPVHLGFLLDGMGVQSPQRIGQAMGISSIAVVLGASTYSPLSRRLGVARQLSLAFALLAAGSLWLAQAGSASGDYPSVVAAASLSSLGGGMAIPTLVNWMMRSVSFAQRGRGTGAFMASFFLGQFICPLVVLGLGAVSGGRLLGAISMMGWGLCVTALIALLTFAFQRFAQSPEALAKR
jgi:MFS family permease